LGRHALLVYAPVTLTFDLKISRGHLLIMTNLNTKYEDLGQRNLKLLGRQTFFKVKVPVTLTLDLKVNRGHLMIMTYLHAKYEDCGSKDT
jgi:hypothetical protein